MNRIKLAKSYHMARSLVVVLSGACILHLPIAQVSAQSQHGGINKVMPEKQLSSMGFDLSPDGLRSALASSNLLARIFATQYIKEKDDRTFAPELKRLLDDKESSVRVEAGMVLASWGEAKAVQVLASELQTAEFIDLRLRAAGGLADAGDSRGFSFVKATSLDEKSLGQMAAASTIRKFARFRNEGIDSLAVQLEAMDILRKKAERKDSENDAKAARFIFRGLAFDLQNVDDPRVTAKLRDASSSSDPVIRSSAERNLKRIEEKQRGQNNK